MKTLLLAAIILITGCKGKSPSPVINPHAYIVCNDSNYAVQVGDSQFIGKQADEKGLDISYPLCRPGYINFDTLDCYMIWADSSQLAAAGFVKISFIHGGIDSGCWAYHRWDTGLVKRDELIMEYKTKDSAIILMNRWNNKIDYQHAQDSIHQLRSQYKPCK